MTTLKKEMYFMLAASMGKNNPVPDIIGTEDQHARAKHDNSISEEESRYMGWGRVKNIFPYTMQDGYNRIKRQKGFSSYVLENEFLKATFIPSLGGRLWSLYDKKAKKELLHVNPVFQPCNLALRNAWISGGVEWNVGIIGHTPFTIDKLFVREGSLKDGTPVLSMYQYERIRKLLYRVEAFLPDSSRFLMVRVRIDNPLDEESKVYWWSNMAVDEKKTSRIIVPAEKAFNFDDGLLRKIDVPSWHDKDLSYAATLPYSMDFFFDVKKQDRKFIASLDKQGYGLVQFSTDTLQGRKLFVWGQGQGGQNWQSYLSREGSAYVEIQAGLAKTQLEHLPIKKRESISWLEGYGALHVAPPAVHSSSYAQAVSETQKALEHAMPRTEFDRLYADYCDDLDTLHFKTKEIADGWAEMEARIDKSFDSCGLQFTHSRLFLAKEWENLFKNGILQERPVLSAPVSYQVGEKWQSLLEKSLLLKGGKHWYSLYQLGAMLSAKGEYAKAKERFLESLAQKASPWAHAALALVYESEKDMESAVFHVLEAQKMLADRHLSLLTLKILNKAGKYSESIQCYDNLPRNLKSLGRAKVLLIEALLSENKLARAEKLLLKPFVIADIREGEFSLSDLWYRLMIQKEEEKKGSRLNEKERADILSLSPPKHLDFRTKAGKDSPPKKEK